MGAQIGALVMEELVLDCQDPAGSIDGSADPVSLLAGVVGGH